MVNLRDFANLLRVNQWTKNLFIFIGIFLSGNLFEFDFLLKTIFGFFVLCLASSSSYIINDLVDIEKDKFHPEKRKRAIASGKIKPMNAKIISAFLLAASVILSYFLMPLFILFPLVLFLSTVNYSLYFKKFAIIDLYFVAFNHVLRAVAGVYLIDIELSSWFILFVFLLSMFLAIGKKKSDLAILGENAQKHKEVYKRYNKKFIDWMVIILLNSMLICYILYTSLGHESKALMITIPFASFLIFRYLYFISMDHMIARKIEYIFTDKQMIIGLILWALAAFVAIYFLGGTQ